MLIIHAILDSVPLSGWIAMGAVILAVLFFFWGPILITTWAGMPTWLKRTIEAITIGTGIYAAGRYAGSKNQKELLKRNNARAETVRTQADETAKAVPDDDLDAQLRKHGGLRDE